MSYAPACQFPAAACVQHVRGFFEARPHLATLLEASIFSLSLIPGHPTCRAPRCQTCIHAFEMMLWTLKFSAQAGQSPRTSESAFSNEIGARCESPETLRPALPQQLVQGHALLAEGGCWGPNGMIERFASEGRRPLAWAFSRLFSKCFLTSSNSHASSSCSRALTTCDTAALHHDWQRFPCTTGQLTELPEQRLMVSSQQGRLFDGSHVHALTLEGVAQLRRIDSLAHPPVR